MVSTDRMCASKEFQIEGADTEKAQEGKLRVIPGGLVRICICTCLHQAFISRLYMPMSRIARIPRCTLFGLCRPFR